MKQKLFFTLIILFSWASIFSQVRITEAMSDAGGTKNTVGEIDWFELTNFGNEAVDISGWKMDDSSYSFGLGATLVGVTTIPAHSSVVFVETETPATDIPLFKSYWGNLGTVSIGSYSASGVSFSSNGDAVVVYDASGKEVTRGVFGASTKGSSFYWTYDAEGKVVDSAAISVVGVINGSISHQTTFVSSNATGNIGSPGSAVVYYSNANVNTVKTTTWTLNGKVLTLSHVSDTPIDVFSITGAKVLSIAPTNSATLDVDKGVYVLKFNGKAVKILVR